MLDFRINTFLTVCKYMNFTHAANELHITQPAVSQHIKYLENYYSTKLFLLDGKKLTLTPSGNMLRDKMTKLKNDESKILDQLQQIASQVTEISFGVTMTIGEYTIIPIINNYLKNHPDSNLKIHFGNTKDLLASLDKGEIDFALIEGYYPENKYETKIFDRVDFIPVCSAKHNFKKAPKELRDLFNERLIIREPGSGTRNILERNLEIHNYSVMDFTHYIQIENMHSVIQLLLLDNGISFLYKSAVEKELSKGKLTEIKLKDFSMKHDFTFIWRKESAFSDEINYLISEMAP